MLRVFVCTSHLSALLLTLYAKRTHLPGQLDHLIVDLGVRRSSVIDAIRMAAGLHEWTRITNLSVEASEEHSFRPGLLRRMIRKWKEAAFIRPLYGLLLQRYQRRSDRRIMQRLAEELPTTPPGMTVSLHVHTECQILRSLRTLHPGAEVSYFEHGQGDYIYWNAPGAVPGSLHVLFAHLFRKYLAARGRDATQVHDLDLGVDFAGIAEMLLKPDHYPANFPVPDSSPIVFVLLEAVDMYQVPDRFWADYMDRIIEDLGDAKDQYFVLKPHPHQSSLSIERTIARLKERGVRHHLLKETHFGIAAEVSFAAWAPHVSHVYALVSTACFYLSVLYPSERITYHYSTSFLERYTRNAPPMYKRLFGQMKPLIEQVFAERCVPY
ncbi:MAG TPA: hypothetical protein PKE21_04105 [Flavobacteriales bacterium]|nr:hypothetical protein [Flavobacteriales bacterium]HMR26641.1 hypothetical protein [Flavobacteriales bacterium]